LQADADEDIRLLIVRLFGSGKIADATPALIQTAEQDASWLVRLEAAFALKHIATSEALAAFQRHDFAADIPKLVGMLYTESNGAEGLFALRMLREIGTLEALAAREAWKTQRRKEE
jgi:HEAT repeat protein